MTLYRNGRPVIGGIGGAMEDAAANVMRQMGPAVTPAEAVAALQAAGIEPPPALLALVASQSRQGIAPSTGGALLRSTAAKGAAVGGDQQSICGVAAQAVARGNAAAPGLVAQCNALRAQNVADGRLMLDGYQVDGSLRVALVSAGERIIASVPALASAMGRLSTADQRGFKMGVAVARALGGLNPSYAAAVRATLAPDIVGGFDAGVSSAASTRATNGGADDGEGVPRAVVIGGAVVGVLAVAAAVYKFSR